MVFDFVWSSLSLLFIQIESSSSLLLCLWRLMFMYYILRITWTFCVCSAYFLFSLVWYSFGLKRYSPMQEITPKVGWCSEAPGDTTRTCLSQQLATQCSHDLSNTIMYSVSCPVTTLNYHTLVGKGTTVNRLDGKESARVFLCEDTPVLSSY